MGHQGNSYEKRNISWEEGTHIISKFGNKAIYIAESITRNAAIIEPSIGSGLRSSKRSRLIWLDTQSQKGLTQNDINKWRRQIMAIDCVCDPVKRLFSDFLHVRAIHKMTKSKPNRWYWQFYKIHFLKSQFLGPDSKLFPFANLTFAEMVNKYLPHFEQLDDENPVKKLFKIGKYANLIQAERQVRFWFKILK